VTPELCATATKRAVLALGAAFALNPASRERARGLGLSRWSLYVAGRAGVLGHDVRPDTVAAALGFVAPEAVRRGWEPTQVIGPVTVAELCLDEWCRHGTRVFSGVAGVERLVALAGRVALAADAGAMPIFAAWRAMPIPDDDPGAQLAVLLHLLREHRVGAQLLAVRSAGLRPVEALVAGPEGEAGAQAYGWEPPFPPRMPLLRRFVHADGVADRIVAQSMRELSPAERAELVTLLRIAMAMAG
jgi:hypothetical protein